jgi:sugar-phosphatase
MSLTTAIFDMDGLLIDSEPLWYEAAIEVMKEFDIYIDQDAYNTTTGLRTKEFLQHWFGFFQIDFERIPTTEEKITSLVISKVISKGEMMDGVEHVLSLTKNKGFKIGLASSSPLFLRILRRPESFYLLNPRRFQ